MRTNTEVTFKDTVDQKEWKLNNYSIVGAIICSPFLPNGKVGVMLSGQDDDIAMVVDSSMTVGELLANVAGCWGTSAEHQEKCIEDLRSCKE